MTTEQALRDTLSQAQESDFQRQIDSFKAFEQKMNAGGYVIQRKHFTIPLMGRVSRCRAAE